jgi:hypothetical protein
VAICLVRGRGGRAEFGAIVKRSDQNGWAQFVFLGVQVGKVTASLRGP